MYRVKRVVRSVVVSTAVLCCAVLLNDGRAAAQGPLPASQRAQPRTPPETDGLPGAQEWGFLRDADSQKMLERAREIRRGMVPVTIEPDQFTDEVIPQVVLLTDVAGRRTVAMTGGFGADSGDFFWVVDPSTGKYRTFKLTGTDADAHRIHQFLQERLPARSQIPLERVQQRLAEAASRKQARTADRVRRAAARRQRVGLNLLTPRPPGLDQPVFRNALFKEPLFGRPGLKPAAALQGYPVCSGGGQAAIGHFDPLWIQLTDTYVWADWWFNGYGDYNVLAGGSCWANPETYVGTHWYLAACYGELNTSVSHALATTENVSYNYDFLFDDQYTWVDDQAYVYQTNGYASWATFHSDWGEAHELIFGYTLLGWAWC